MKWIYEKYNFIIENLPQTPLEGVVSSTRHAVYNPDGTLRDTDIPNGRSALNGYVFTNYSDYAFDRPQKYYYGVKTLSNTIPTGNTLYYTQRVPLAENVTHQEFCSLFGTKTTHIETLVAEDGAFPDDGVHDDLKWYVKIKKAFPAMRIMRDGQWVEVEAGYVLKDGVWKPIEEIYKLQDGQWVQA